MSGTELVLDPVSRAPGAARRWVRDQLSRLGREQLSDTAELLVTEVVTNAVLHAGTPIRVTLHPDGPGVRVDVRDGSSTEPVVRRHRSLVAVGRGLSLLEQLASQWGWGVEREGKVVWFVVRPDEADVRAAGPAEVRPEPPPGPTESGLGRYVEADGGPRVRIRLLGLPVRLLAASQEHHDALIREFRLMALAGADSAERHGPPGLDALVEELGIHHGRTRGRRDREIQEALDAGVLRIDQEFLVPTTAGDDMRHVRELLAEADRYCDDNLLLTLSRPPLIRRFTTWYVDEIARQVDGLPPRPWSGPVTLDAEA